MFFCKNCGAKIDNDNAKFCPKCGQKFEPKQNDQPVKSTDNNANAAEKFNKAAHISQPPIADEIKKSDKNNNNINNNNINNKINSSSNPAPVGNIPHPVKIKKQQIKNNNSNKHGKGLLAVLIVLMVIVLGSAGTLIYFYKTGRLNKYKKEIYRVLHIKQNKSSHKKHQSSLNSSKTKSKKALKKSKVSKKKNETSKSQSSASVSPASSAVPQTAAQNSAPTYVYSNNVSTKHSYANSGNGLTLFKGSLASARAYITGISPLNNSGVGDAPAVIISNVLANGANAAQGKTIVLHSKFYAETPADFSSQSVKLTYEIYGNDFTAYNNSHVNVTKPGIYSVALSISVPADFPTGIYNYTLTVTSTATIEESAAANLKIQQ
ncbi:MAG: zinc ribbon domain-containing protein [Candidatus Acididesulfobacter guangdongensis]|uniref:Zinc ribbon domain-containing protein n=1 Tax=Acididesulfobacter guangdongensis TaxID=2597225 RepID=A0A519BFA3_ACIG2|nr:MAG: zinc ribbon domain-containing protein [Candidatus Acididesulfobacter guangdongensis]